MSEILSLEEIQYCLDYAEGKEYLKFTKIENFPESLLPSHAAFYDVWNEFWELISPILEVEIYDCFYDLLGDAAYFRYRDAGITTVGDFLLFCCKHTKREGNILLGEQNAKFYKRGLCFERLRYMIFSECLVQQVPHREEMTV